MFASIKPRKTAGKILPAALILALAGIFIPSVPSWAAEEAPVEAEPFTYPDLGSCMDKLRDPASYKGKRKILRFIYPGKDGWLFRSVDFRTDFTMPDQVLGYMKKVNERLAAKGIELVVLLQPSRGMLMRSFIDPNNKPDDYDPAKAEKSYRALISQLNRVGIESPDLSDVPSDVVYFFKGDPHWRREGAHWTAQRLASVIRKYPAYKDVKYEEFSNEVTWWLESEKGEFDEFIEKTCDVEMPPERRPQWATTVLAGDLDESALFGDVTYPDIAIVGTSNTAHDEDFNFVGALKQELNTDIRNRALSAGAFSGSSLVFYAMDEFHNHPPKIIIWEFLAHHDFDDYVGFRQIIPAIEGACTDEEALAVTTINLEGAFPASEAKAKDAPLHDVLVFEDLEDQQIPGKGSYLYLEATEPNEQKMQVGILYANGDAEEVDISRSRRVDNNGKYYLQFDPAIEQNLLMIQIGTNKPQGMIKARICKGSI